SPALSATPRSRCTSSTSAPWAPGTVCCCPPAPVRLPTRPAPASRQQGATASSAEDCDPPRLDVPRSGGQRSPMAEAQTDWFAQPAPPTDDEVLYVGVGGYEGPLDLLLGLARRQKVDVAKISVLALAE